MTRSLVIMSDKDLTPQHNKNRTFCALLNPWHISMIISRSYLDYTRDYIHFFFNRKILFFTEEISVETD